MISLEQLRKEVAEYREANKRVGGPKKYASPVEAYRAKLNRMNEYNRTRKLNDNGN